MADIYQDLEKLNFSPNEAKVYLTLIKIGPSFAGRISKEANLDRSSTYNALKQLIERGIVSTVFEKKRNIYVPADPKKIVDYYREKEELANRVIPSLRQLFGIKKEKKSVSLFQGYKGIKTLCQDILDSREEYYVMGSEGQFRENMPYYAPIFKKIKEERKIRTKMLVREGRTKMSRWAFSDYRAVPSDVASPTTINIYDGKVAIFIWDEKPEAVLIENEGVAQTLKNYFDFMWKHAKKL